MLGRPAGFDHIKPLNGWTTAHSGPLTPPIYLDDRPFLAYDISRPASANSLPSGPIGQYPLQRLSSAPSLPVQLPALSTLASLAAASVPNVPR